MEETKKRFEDLIKEVFYMYYIEKFEYTNNCIRVYEQFRDVAFITITNYSLEYDPSKIDYATCFLIFPKVIAEINELSTQIMLSCDE